MAMETSNRGRAWRPSLLPCPHHHHHHHHHHHQLQHHHHYLHCHHPHKQCHIHHHCHHIQNHEHNHLNKHHQHLSLCLSHRPNFPQNQEPPNNLKSLVISGCQETPDTASSRVFEEQELHGIDEEEDEDPIFVLTDEWMEFFAKSEAKRKLEKKQAKKGKK